MVVISVHNKSKHKICQLLSTKQQSGCCCSEIKVTKNLLKEAEMKIQKAKSQINEVSVVSLQLHGLS